LIIELLNKLLDPSCDLEFPVVASIHDIEPQTISVSIGVLNKTKNYKMTPQEAMEFGEALIELANLKLDGPVDITFSSLPSQFKSPDQFKNWLGQKLSEDFGPQGPLDKYNPSDN